MPAEISRWTVCKEFNIPWKEFPFIPREELMQMYAILDAKNEVEAIARAEAEEQARRPAGRPDGLYVPGG